MQKFDASDLPKLTKNARHQAIIGNYVKSLEIYKIMMGIIKRRIEFECKDTFIIQKWQKVETALKEECATILQAYDFCKIFQEDSWEKRMQRESEENNRVLMRDYKPNKRRSEVPDGVKAHFGGKMPFEYLHDRDREQPRRGGDERMPKSYGRDYCNFGRDIGYDDFRDLRGAYKDPDVWDEPEDMPKRNINRRKSDGRVPPKEPKFPNPYNTPDLEKKRNYDKPWKVPEVVGKKDKSNTGKTGNASNKKGNAADKGKDKGKDKPDNSGKSEFLLARYPEDNGNGPDTDLVNMIEMDVLQKNPNVSLNDIAGLETAKKALQEAVILPLMMPEYFTGLRKPFRGILLYGPPGTGKTLLAKALATIGKTTFFNVSATTFASKWRGESEKLVRILFEMARFYGPSTIFIDEIDSIGGKRTDGDNEASRRVMSEMLVQMDGVSSTQTLPKPGENSDKDSTKSGDTATSEAPKPKNVMVLGATNHPWSIDEALRRRFEKRIYIPLPPEKGRQKMFEINLKDINLDKDIDFKELVKLTEGYSGADIANVCREAALMQMRQKLNSSNGVYDIMDANGIEQLKKELENAPVTMKDIKAAIKNISKSVSKNDLKRYEDWTKEFANV